MIVLVGFMGAGKSTVGPLVARRLGLPFVDVDRVVEERAGAPVAELFATRGEDAFRALESAAAADALDRDDGVVALGGGALGDDATRAQLRDHTVVYLRAPYEELVARIGNPSSRPLLARGDARALWAARGPVYERVADIVVDTAARDAHDVAREVAARAEVAAVRRVVVGLRERAYEVAVGHGIAARVARWLPDERGDAAFVVTHPELARHAAAVRSSLEAAGMRVHALEVPAGEGSKSLATAQALYSELARRAAHRDDVVVSVGGGVVCDVAGFVASTYNRGMQIVHVPTTLLAQVDAAIGGKTGVNLPHGKNLVGTFHQPHAVVCDVATLTTLPDAELRSGLAEVVKYGLIADPSLLERVVSGADALLARDAAVLGDVVAASAAIKAGVVAADEREAGVRAHLNYGHTFAHALETLRGHGELRHGEAVAVGMMAAAHLARVLERIDDADVDVHRRALESVGLPVSASLELRDLESAWVRDKKFRGTVRFVLLAGVGKPEAGIAAPRDALERALERLAR
ncbi:MAG TPA: 3-dehydroquinate synthase [Actinomycetota bacterium]|nr:3-dehydroquinate synthase [Actinomycetota bacterium]